MDERTYTLTADRLAVEIDAELGVVSEVRAEDADHDLNFVANEANTGVDDCSDTRWVGDVVTSTWQFDDPEAYAESDQIAGEGSWQRETTGRSDDIRTVSRDSDGVTVRYAGTPADDGGLQRLDVAVRYTVDDDGLHVAVTIENTTALPLDVGELAFPLAANDHYGEIYGDQHQHAARLAGEMESVQRAIHERKVLAHHFVGGHSSYSLLQRPLGDPPFLLAHPVGDTPFECKYTDFGSFTEAAGWSGPELLAVHSKAVQDRNGWKRWVNGHSSVVLSPGEHRTYGLRFTLVESFDERREELAAHGNLGVRVVPSMVVPEETTVHTELLGEVSVDEIRPLSDNVEIVSTERTGRKTLLTCRFEHRGQKTVEVRYGDGRWTTLHFYCVPAIRSLLKARSRFIVERQFYENPDDPSDRHHTFLPFDYQYGSTFRESDQAWEVGASDEYGFSEPLFLAIKNVYYPNEHEIDVLETYVTDSLLGDIQDPDTNEVRASLYWTERKPSSPWGHWSEERSKASGRAYNYPHVANIYHALYRIGEKYDLLTSATPESYLERAADTCLYWLQKTEYWDVGLMCASNALDILTDLDREGLRSKHDRLRSAMVECADSFANNPYPYGSEYYVDQTAHEQVYFFSDRFDHAETVERTVQVLQALRGGDEPVWFQYGIDTKGKTACWYSEALNGTALLDRFERTGDRSMLRRGFAGLMSVTANLLPDGMGFGSFDYTPGEFTFGWETMGDNQRWRTLDNGIGQYGYFKGATAYVVDDETFGLVGYGCEVEVTDGRIQITPNDGVSKRVHLVERGLEIAASAGEFDAITVDDDPAQLRVRLSDSTGVVEESEVTVRAVRGRDSTESASATGVTDENPIELIVPASEFDEEYTIDLPQSGN